MAFTQGFPKDATSAMQAISMVILEDIDPTIESSIPALDSHYQQLKTTAMGVTARSGRDFEAKHVFRQGVAGTVKWVSEIGGTQPLGNFEQIVARKNAAGSGGVTAYPGLAENVVPGHITATVTLARAKGNILLPVEYAKADVMGDATIANNVREVVIGAAENVLLSEIHQYYRMTITDAQAIAKIATTPTFADKNATKDQITFVVGTGSIRNFYPGMLIDFHNPTGPARRNAANKPVAVDTVRYLPDTSSDTGGWGQVVALSTEGENLDATAGVASGDAITRVDSEGNGPLGPEDWLVTTGTIFGLNVATFPQFQSISQAVSGALTDPYLSKIFGRICKAYGVQHMPDTIVTSDGVTNAHVEQSDGLSRFQRNGQPMVVADGYEFGEVPFRHRGRNVGWQISDFMPSLSDMTAASQTGGRLWAMKTRDRNIMRYIPPLRPGTAGAEPIPREVEFLMPIGGPLGFFKPRHNSSGDVVDCFEAPFDRWLAIAPRWIPGIKLTTINESI